MPDTPIVDAHVHLWDPQRLRLAWIDGSAVLERAYGLAEFDQHTAGLDIEAFVYLEVGVEPVYALVETQHVAALARSEPRLKAIVAHAPVEHGAIVRSYLDALTAIDGPVRGVRRITQGETDPRFCARPGFVRGVQCLAEYDLSFDICINHTQLAGAIELVRQCPGVQFMLDHIAKPDIRGGVLEPWRTQIAELATHPNVMCKVSGMVTEADHAAWTPEQLRPYLAHVLDVFGEDRVCFGGDWPVVLLASSYHRWTETLDALTADLSPEGRRKLWAGNARRFYHILQRSA
jgi:L-fuconolactonase